MGTPALPVDMPVELPKDMTVVAVEDEDTESKDASVDFVA